MTVKKFLPPVAASFENLTSCIFSSEAIKVLVSFSLNVSFCNSEQPAAAADMTRSMADSKDKIKLASVTLLLNERSIWYPLLVVSTESGMS